jgi:hypothetical protein
MAEHVPIKDQAHWCCAQEDDPDHECPDKPLEYVGRRQHHDNHGDPYTVELFKCPVHGEQDHWDSNNDFCWCEK